MKKIICIISLFISLQLAAQEYQYYFIELRTTGKAEVELSPEMGVTYSDIDSLIVSSREVKKNGVIMVTGRKYASYSAAFNRLSREGLEFVQFANLSTVGGGTAFIAGDIRINYTVWRKKIQKVP